MYGFILKIDNIWDDLLGNWVVNKKLFDLYKMCIYVIYFNVNINFDDINNYFN